MEDPHSFLLPPPGFRFQPSDEDLISHYLWSRHLPPQSRPSSLLLHSAIKDFDVYGVDPENLSDAACLLYADDEKRWYFFTPRAKGKLAGAARRKAKGGCWRKKGLDQPVVSRHRGEVVGTKKKFVFYRGASPNRSMTRWVMLEYELADSEFSPGKECFALCCVFTEEKRVPVPDSCDEHNGVLAEGLDNGCPPMERFSYASVIEDTNDATMLFETAVRDGDFIELNDLLSPLEGDFIELNDFLSPLPNVSMGRGDNQL